MDCWARIPTVGFRVKKVLELLQGWKWNSVVFFAWLGEDVENFYVVSAVTTPQDYQTWCTGFPLKAGWEHIGNQGSSSAQDFSMAAWGWEHHISSEITIFNDGRTLVSRLTAKGNTEIKGAARWKKERVTSSLLGLQEYFFFMGELSDTPLSHMHFHVRCLLSCCPSAAICHTTTKWNWILVVQH